MFSFKQAFLLAVTFAAVSSAPLGSGLADEGSSEQARRAHRIASEVMSPYCPGRTLADCPSPRAGELRAEIRELVNQGLDNDAILTRLEARFGDAIVGVPRSILGWTVPGLVLIVGAAVLIAALRRLSSGRTPQAEPGSEGTAIEKDLDRELGL
jgi:cytochrome c-type biogenesis protein CcmH